MTTEQPWGPPAAPGHAPSSSSVPMLEREPSAVFSAGSISGPIPRSPLGSPLGSASADLPFASAKRSRRVPLIAAGALVVLALVAGVVVSRNGSGDDAASSTRETIPYSRATPQMPGTQSSGTQSSGTQSSGTQSSGTQSSAPATASADDSSPPSLPAGARALSEVAAKTLKQGTARMSMTVNVPIPGVSAGPMLVEGTVDLDRGVMSYVMDFSKLLEGEDVPPGVDGKVEAVQSGLIMFMRGSMFDAVPGVDGKWLRLDMTPTTVATGLDTNKAATVSGNGPTSALAMLQDAGSVVDMGTETVRGASTRHYSASIDVEAMYRKSGMVVDEAAFSRLMSAMPMKAIPVDVWIDDAGRVRRQEMVLALGGSMMHSVVELYDFGVKTNIVVPDFADSVDMMKLIARG